MARECVSETSNRVAQCLDGLLWRQDQQVPVFAICDDYGTVTEPIDIDFKNCPAGLSITTGFEPNNSVLEICGRCSTGLPNN